MSQTYKLNHIENDIIKSIYIFSNDDSIKNPEYNDSNDNPIFSEKSPFPSAKSVTFPLAF